MKSHMPDVENLDRFQIEAIYAFKLAEHNTDTAADIMHITRAAMYNDLAIVKKRTGLNPYEKDQFRQILEEVEAVRKEKMHGANFDIGSYLCGK